MNLATHWDFTCHKTSLLLWKWLKIGEIEVCWICQNRGPNGAVRGPNLSVVFCLLVRQKSVAEWRNSRPEFSSKKYNRNVFLGWDFVPIYEGYFYYKYRLCIEVNLEIEGVETMVYKGNNKTRVCLLATNTRVWGLIHLRKHY